MTTRNASRTRGDTQARIEIPANLIRDVRLGAISQLHINAETLGHNAECYYGSQGPRDGVAYADYSDSFDSTRRLLELLDDIGDDFTIEEPVKKIKLSYGYLIAKATRWQSDLLRSRLQDVVGSLDGPHLVGDAERIAALEQFADYAEASAQMWDAEHGEDEEA